MGAIRDGITGDIRVTDVKKNFQTMRGTPPAPPISEKEPIGFIRVETHPFGIAFGASVSVRMKGHAPGAATR